MRRNTSFCTGREIEALLDRLDQLVATCTSVLQRIAPPESSLFTQVPMFCLHLVFSLNLRATQAPCRSRAGHPSNLGAAVSAVPSTFEYERHRACPSVKTSTDQPSHVPLHARTLRGAALSSWGTSLSSLLRASRVQGFQGPYGGSQLVPTLYRIYIFCFQMCNRLLELMKNGYAGIFPVYYSLERLSDLFYIAPSQRNLTSVYCEAFSYFGRGFHFIASSPLDYVGGKIGVGRGQLTNCQQGSTCLSPVHAFDIS